MANLGDFDASRIEPSQFEALPPGRYRVQVTQSEIRPTKDGNGSYLWLELDILEGPFAGRKLWDRLNLNNQSAQAVEIAQRQLSALCYAVGKLKVADSSELHLIPLDINGAANSELQGTLEAIADALRFIPNEDLAYGDWVRIAMALKGALGDAGWSLFEDWSAQSNKNIPATTLSVWHYARPTRIGAGTIYHHARANGWTPAPGLTLNGSDVAAGQHPAQELLDRIVRTQ
jgi:Protein of unknown function (DUF669)/Primase C terminal 2 (PriCT-2)